MKDVFKNVEKIDFSDIYEWAESRQGLCYDYYFDDYYDIFFQEAARHEISFKEYREKEQKILRWIKLLGDDGHIYGWVSPFGKIKNHYSTRKSIDYRKRMYELEKKGKVDRYTLFSFSELETAFVMGIRDVAAGMFYFENLEILIKPSDLHGLVLFKTDKYEDYIRNQAAKFGLTMEKWRQCE